MKDMNEIYENIDAIGSGKNAPDNNENIDQTGYKNRKRTLIRKKNNKSDNDNDDGEEFYSDVQNRQDKYMEFLPKTYIPSRNVKKFLAMLLTTQNSIWVWIARISQLVTPTLILGAIIRGWL